MRISPDEHRIQFYFKIVYVRLQIAYLTAILFSLGVPIVGFAALSLTYSVKLSLIQT